MFSHEEEKIYFCVYCDKTFTAEVDYLAHNKVHTDSQRYKCNVCNKLCFDSYSLSKHKKTHSRETVFKCNICQKTVSRISRLRKHILSHSEAKPNRVPVCSLCHIAFADEDDVLKHIVKDHENDDDEKITVFMTDRVFCCEFCEM